MTNLVLKAATKLAYRTASWREGDTTVKTVKKVATMRYKKEVIAVLNESTLVIHRPETVSKAAKDRFNGIMEFFNLRVKVFIDNGAFVVYPGSLVDAFYMQKVLTLSPIGFELNE